MITDWIYGARPGAWGGAQWFVMFFQNIFWCTVCGAQFLR